MLVLCTLLVAVPLAAAGEEGYYVDVSVSPPRHGESSASTAPTCAVEGGLEGSVEQGAREAWDGTTRWGLPYVAPRCLAVDASVGDAAPGAQVSYDLATGAYVLQAPAGPGGTGGRTGVAVRFDCIECPPPWESILP